jgi:Tfp pilus assembly protein PilZ
MSINPPRIIREQRYKCEMDISHDNVIPDIHYDGIISNLSSGGIYFESNESIIPGDAISVTVKKLNEEEITFDVYIIWKKDLPNSPFRFGYGAKSVSQKESIVQIRDQDVNRITEFADKREYQRKIFNKQIRLKNHNQVYNGQIRDISRGGAFIETDSIFPIGKKIVLTLSGKTARKSVKLMGWIVRKDSDGFGITFDRRCGSERRYDIDRRKGLDRRNRNERNKTF